MKMIMLLIPFLILSCGKASYKKSSEAKQDVKAIYASSELNVSIFYEEGAEPYTDGISLLNLNVWDLFQTNISSLLDGRNITLKVPKTLSEMNKLSNSGKKTWSIDDILSLSRSHPVTGTSNSSNFQIFYVNGVAEQNAGIIGFHIDKTKVIAVFKDVIRKTASNDALVPKYVEQATLIHEMGHALGLVNNGLPMISSHQDSTNGSHCSNPNCVMYYENEGASSLVKYVNKVKDEKSLIMFDVQCLEDARSYKN